MVGAWGVPCMCQQVGGFTMRRGCGCHGLAPSDLVCAGVNSHATTRQPWVPSVVLKVADALPRCAWLSVGHSPADAAEETYKVCVPDHVAAFVSHRVHELVHPDGRINRQALAADGFDVDTSAYRLQKLPQAVHSHLRRGVARSVFAYSVLTSGEHQNNLVQATMLASRPRANNM
jgi:uroporphyrinogen-III synthase